MKKQTLLIKIGIFFLVGIFLGRGFAKFSKVYYCAERFSPSSPASFGVQIDPRGAQPFCQFLKELNGAYTGLWLKWEEIDQGEGNYKWEVVDNKISLLENCGLKAAVHLQAGRKLKDSNEPATYYSDYFSFLKAFVARYKDKIDRYSIENEAISPVLWPDTPESYFRFLDNAYKVIKEVSPEAIVEEGGLSSVALGIARADDLYKKGKKEEALALVQEFFSQSESFRDKIPSSISDLEKILQSPEGKRVLVWFDLLREHQNSLDVIQVHFYGGWVFLRETLNWLKLQGINKPFEVWEVGKHYFQEEIDDDSYAGEVVKLLTTAAGEGSQLTIFVRFIDWPEKALPGLWTKDGPRPAALAFKYITGKLSNTVSSSFDVSLWRGDIFGYKFTNGEKDFYVIWALDKTKVYFPFGKEALVTDIFGKPIDFDGESLLVETKPILVEVDSSSFRKGDLNYDGRVDIEDIKILISKYYYSEDRGGDLNDDGKVNGLDLWKMAILIFKFG